MKGFFKDQNTVKNCHIYQMLQSQSVCTHFSFHTPGHKQKGWDITELSYSDNLSSPRGCIAEAEKDIAQILGAEKSFILTDGSTSGVFSMLYAAKMLGARTIAVCENSHKSVFNGCAALGLKPLVFPVKREKKIPLQPTMYALKLENPEILMADVFFITSPDYYGNVADFKALRAFCDENKKMLLVDGAHGGHLHFDRALYAGAYADMWVDGVHKSLPALTQGAVVSARTKRFATALREAVDVFRTTSPSYPIMASVEYAVKYPRNEALEKAVEALKTRADLASRIYFSEDWTKLCVLFGKNAFSAEKELEEQGVYAEFCDGNLLMFYLSPATSKKQFSVLVSAVLKLIEKYPYKKEENSDERNPAPLIFKNYEEKQAKTEWVDLSKAKGKICAQNCGLFPPCTPLIVVGERIEEEKIELLQHSANVYGLWEGKIRVLQEKGEN